MRGKLARLGLVVALCVAPFVFMAIGEHIADAAGGPVTITDQNVGYPCESGALGIYTPDGGTAKNMGCRSGHWGPLTIPVGFLDSSKAFDGGIVVLHGATVDSLYDSTWLGVDGGEVVHGGLRSDTAYVSAGLSADGGEIVQNGLTVTGGETADTAYVSNTLGIDGGLTILSGTLTSAGGTLLTGQVLFSNAKNVGNCTLGTNCNAISVTTGAHCWCQDVTLASPCKPVVTSNTLVITGTSTDSIVWGCQ